MVSVESSVHVIAAPIFSAAPIMAWVLVVLGTLCSVTGCSVSSAAAISASAALALPDGR